MSKFFLSPSVQTRNLYALNGEKISEHDVCEKIALACGAYLVNNGEEAFCYTGLNMYTAVAMSNVYLPAYHVCIHTNAIASNKKTCGQTIFCHPNNVKDKALVGVHENLLKLNENDKGIRATTKLYEIGHTKAKCIYIEVDFHDNPACAEWLANNTAEIGRAIAYGLMNKTYEPVDNAKHTIPSVKKCKCGCNVCDL